MDFPSKVIDNFLSDSELDDIESFVLANTNPWINYSEGKPEVTEMSTYYVFDFYSAKFKKIYDMMWPLFQQHFGDIYIGEIHIFDSKDPYHIHSDVQSGIWENPAWTFIIPLADYDSHTIVFNEGSPQKDPRHYIESHPPHNPPLINDETYHKYFSHIYKECMSWFSIESIFPWKRGSLFAASRCKFHTSDNYIANGISSKRALVAWTNTKPPGSKVTPS